MENFEIAIIGAGPAGIAAAIQLKRYGHDPVIFEQKNVGGLLVNANLVENYLGLPGGISGRTMVKMIAEQVDRFSLQIRYEKVLSLDYDDISYVIKTDKGTYMVKTVIVASGTMPLNDIHIDINANIRDRVLFEIDSILDVEDKHIGIIGAGDAAFDYALNLGKKNRVTIFNRGSLRKCLPLLYERARAVPNITYLENAILKSLDISDKLKVIMHIDREDTAMNQEVDFLIFAIGRKPRLDFLSTRVQEKRAGLENNGSLYFIGDVANSRFRQVSVAAGDGIKTAMIIHNKLRKAHK